MPKNNRKWNNEKYLRYLKEGRGSGEGVDYKPWFNIEDFSSAGFSTKSSGWKTRRVHQFASQNELRYYYLLEWSDIVVDIREQFPLIDIDTALGIANNLGIKYPIDKESQTPYVLSTDFVITLNKKGKTKMVARTVKPSSELERKSVLDKLEIERRYWKSLGVDWGIVTEKEIPVVFAENIEWVHSHYYLEEIPEIDSLNLRSVTAFLKNILRNNDGSIVYATNYVDNEMHLEPGSALKAFRYLIAHKEVLINMRERIKLAKPSTSIEIIAGTEERDANQWIS